MGPLGEEGPGLWTGDRALAGLTSVLSRSPSSGTTLRILNMPVQRACVYCWGACNDWDMAQTDGVYLNQGSPGSVALYASTTTLSVRTAVQAMCDSAGLLVPHKNINFAESDKVALSITKTPCCMCNSKHKIWTEASQSWDFTAALIVIQYHGIRSPLTAEGKPESSRSGPLAADWVGVAGLPLSGSSYCTKW